MSLWTLLFDVAVILVAAVLLGMVFERLRQSAMLGYLVAGALLGPGALNLVGNKTVVAEAADLGVVLLLFGIGLEFSWQRLRSLGLVASVGGLLQVGLTGSITAIVVLVLGGSVRVAVAVASMVALSSTAAVLRILTDRAELDSVHGRAALGILLLQDLMVVPLVLLVTLLGRSGSAVSALWNLGRAVALGAALVVLFRVIANHVLPGVLRETSNVARRELGILVAIATFLSAAWAAHGVGLSPALGAFVAGMLLAESPYAAQVKADVAGLRTLFVTLFFVSVGMLAEPAWVAAHASVVVTAVAAVIVGKAATAWLAIRLVGIANRAAVAAGVSLAQVGEFSFVLAQVGLAAGLLSRDAHALIISTTLLTLFVTPYLVAGAPDLAELMIGAARVRGRDKDVNNARVGGRWGPHVVVVGFGPAGVAVADALAARGVSVVVVELNPRTAAAARERGLEVVIGDGAQVENLEAAHVGAARVVVITIPDQRAAVDVIRQVRALAPTVACLVRARHRIAEAWLRAAGAEVVVDEEQEVGERLGITAAALVRGETP
jgi:K+:H+ antiporter